MSRAVATTGILVKRGTGAAAPAPATISAISAANPTVITTSAASGLTTGEPVTITGSNSTPSVDGTWIVTVLSGTTFSIPIAVTVAGTAGSVQGTAATGTIGELVSVTPPRFTKNKIETSTHNDKAESNILGILRQEDAAFRINFLGDEPTHQQLIADMLSSPAVVNLWQVVFPSGIIFQGNARVSRFAPVDAPVDAAQQADVSLVWAGPVGWYI